MITSNQTLHKVNYLAETEFSLPHADASPKYASIHLPFPEKLISKRTYGRWASIPRPCALFAAKLFPADHEVQVETEQYISSSNEYYGGVDEWTGDYEFFYR